MTGHPETIPGKKSGWRKCDATEGSLRSDLPEPRFWTNSADHSSAMSFRFPQRKLVVRLRDTSLPPARVRGGAGKVRFFVKGAQTKKAGGPSRASGDETKE